METTFRDLEYCWREVDITLTNAELQPHFNKAYIEAGKSVTINGFRTGKAPLAMVKQKYGRTIEADAITDVASEEFKTIVNRDNIKLAGQGSMTDLQRTNEGVKYTIKYEVYPQFELVGHKGLELNRFSQVTTEDDIDKEVRQLLLKHSTLETAEKATDNLHVVAVTLKKLDPESGLPLIGSDTENSESSVFLDDDRIDELMRVGLLNLGAGESFTYQPKSEGEPRQFIVTVTEVQKVTLPELSNEMVETETNGQLLSTEQYRDAIRTELENHWTSHSREHLESDIISALVEKHDFAVPQMMVLTVAQSMLEDIKKKHAEDPAVQKMTLRETPQLFPSAERFAKWDLISQAIIETEALEIEDKDVETLTSFFGGDMEQTKKWISSNDEFSHRLMTKKVFDTIIDKAVITEKAFEAGHSHDH